MTTWQNVFMVVDDGRAPMHAYAVQDAHLTKLAARYPGNCGRLVILPADSTPPSDEARRAINTLVERHAAALKCVVCVVEGTGFEAALLRATLTTMTRTLRKMRGWKVVSNVDEGLGHIIAGTRMRPDGTVVARDLADARRALAEIRQPRQPAERAAS